MAGQPDYTALGEHLKEAGDQFCMMSRAVPWNSGQHQTTLINVVESLAQGIRKLAAVVVMIGKTP
jgi:hypothetical protein